MNVSCRAHQIGGVPTPQFGCQDCISAQNNEDMRTGLCGHGEFLNWLTSMDDPEDREGMRARQTVTLTEIIRRAREVR